MSLVICTQCGRGVSTEAAACPGCGQPGPTLIVPPRANVYLEGIDGPVRRTGSGPFVAAAAVLLVGGAAAAFVGARAAPADFEHEVTFEHSVEVVEAPVAVSVDGPATFELSEVDVAPALAEGNDLASAVGRVYPQLLRDAGVNGQVMLRFRVTPEGVVDAASITVESASHDHFAGAAREALEGMHFTPAEMEGEPVAVWMTLPMEFVSGS